MVRCSMGGLVKVRCGLGGPSGYGEVRHARWPLTAPLLIEGFGEEESSTLLSDSSLLSRLA